jgi:putative sigma-54 modulation protein
MKLDIRAVHFDLNDEIRDYAAEKIGKLDKFYKNIIMAEIKLMGNSGVEAVEDKFEATVRLSVPGKDVYAEEKGRDIHEAIDLVERELQRQLKKIKDKQNPKRLAKTKEIVRRFFGKEE